jgi:hypothetical protein
MWLSLCIVVFTVGHMILGFLKDKSRTGLNFDLNTQGGDLSDW